MARKTRGHGGRTAYRLAFSSDAWACGAALDVILIERYVGHAKALQVTRSGSEPSRVTNVVYLMLA